jgi:predicted GIY-YIG superfamily endonuclease
MSALTENCGNCGTGERVVAVRPLHAQYQAGGGWRYWYRCPECGHRWGVTRPDEGASDHVPHWLYRIYGTEGELLYIGITKSLPARLSRHGREPHWSLEIRDVTAHWYPDEPSAYAAETDAIKAEKPLWNVAKARERIPRKPPAIEGTDAA